MKVLLCSVTFDMILWHYENASKKVVKIFLSKMYAIFIKNRAVIESVQIFIF